MPIKWTPELDSIIIHGIFEECNISFSKALCAKIAERVEAVITDECSPKAVENRLYSWKKKNVASNPVLNGTKKSTAGNTVPNGTKKTPTKPACTSKNPRNRNRKTTAKKMSDDSSEGPDDVVSPSAASGKRAGSKRSYAEYEDESEAGDYKRIKAEPLGDDEDEDSYFATTEV